MRILVACEESQAVTIAFRKRGFEAFSCDILPCSGGHPEWHLQQDVTDLLKQKWDAIIAFPPCTRLTVTANKWYKPEYSDRFPNIHREREEAIKFFMMFVNSECDNIAIENPVGIMSSKYRKPDQTVQPWQFGDAAIKRTCFWLKGFPKLKSTKIVDPEFVEYKSTSNKSENSKYSLLWKMSPSKERTILRSKTFPGIAEAMADQWGDYLIYKALE